MFAAACSVSFAFVGSMCINNMQTLSHRTSSHLIIHLTTAWFNLHCLTQPNGNGQVDSTGVMIFHSARLVCPIIFRYRHGSDYRLAGLVCTHQGILVNRMCMYVTHVGKKAARSSWIRSPSYLQRTEDRNLGWQTHWIMVDEHLEKDPTISYRTMCMTCYDWLPPTLLSVCRKKPSWEVSESCWSLSIWALRGDLETSSPQEKHQGFLDFESGSKSLDPWTMGSWM